MITYSLIPFISEAWWHFFLLINTNKLFFFYCGKFKNLVQVVTRNHVWWNSECSHGPLEKLERNDWLEPETPPFLALTDVVTDKRFIDSFKYYANFEYTGDIEVYNSLQGVYSPKRVFFRYTSQKLRMRLSAIDFNHHVNLPQKTNESGELLVSRRWSNFW